MTNLHASNSTWASDNNFPISPSGQILSFFLLFYIVLGGIFAAHLAVFIHLTPEAGVDVTPWNFGRYAYPNYPNAKIGMLHVCIVYISTAADSCELHRVVFFPLPQHSSLSPGK